MLCVHEIRGLSRAFKQKLCAAGQLPFVILSAAERSRSTPLSAVLQKDEIHSTAGFALRSV